MSKLKIGDRELDGWKADAIVIGIIVGWLLFCFLAGYLITDAT